MGVHAINFYKHHLGDYDGATAHLSWDEDLAYRRLLGVYYRTEEAIPASQAHRLVRATTAKQKAAVDTVLGEFFERDGDLWRNKRADREIAEYQAKASLSRAVGKKGGNPYWEQQYEHPGFLYAARIDDQRVKIGITKDWNQRKHGLARTYKTALKLIKLAQVPCMGVAEEAILHRFEAYADGEVLSLPADREAELLAVMAEYDQPAGLVVASPNQEPLTKNQEPEESKSTTLAQASRLSLNGTELIPLKDGTAWQIPSDFLTELQRLCPRVDAVLTLREIRVWCLGNEERLKTKRGVKRFVAGWFSREQAKADGAQA